MFGFIIKRLLAAIPLLLILSMISFFLIQIPPGDYADKVKSQAITMSGMSEQDAQQMADKYREEHGMNAPLPVQYVRWVGNIVTKGDFGDSYTYNKPISQLILDRLPMTLLIALMCHFGSTVIGTLLGIFVATRQYSIADTVVTVFAFIGMTTPLCSGVDHALSAGLSFWINSCRRTIFARIHHGAMEHCEIRRSACSYLASSAGCHFRRHGAKPASHALQYAGRYAGSIC